MSGISVTHRRARTRFDPVDSESAARSAVESVMHRPPRAETIVIPLDDRRCGLAVIVVTGTNSPDAIVDVVDIIGWQARQNTRFAAAVVGSVRPGGSVETRDIDRWLEASEVLDEHGVELLEWFVIGDEIWCPRDLLGERPRWAA
ncbi:MAG: hypothetical protein QNM02_04320 [Acidimicrobiia bacterium]|nr:hypothetical protein [Acidimicrobiia bacterium]